MLKLTVVWQDVDLIECEVEARSGTFAASERLYFTAATLRELATAFAGFPRTASDSRQYETANSEGGNRMKIRLDGAGLLVELHDRESSGQYGGIRLIPEAAAIDRFERELIHLADDRAGTAVLDCGV